MSFENLLLERDGAVAVLTINRPRVPNALNSSTIDQVRRAVLDLTHDTEVRAVIITGAGETSFVIGADINELVGRPAAELATKAPVAVRDIIEAVNRGLEASFDEGQFLEATRFGLIASIDDVREGTMAFLEQRKANFTGR